MRYSLITVLLGGVLRSAAAGDSVLFLKNDTGTVGGGCGEWLKATTEVHRAMNTQFVLGYLAARNIHEDEEVLKDTTIPTIEAYVSKHCRDFPLHTLTKAAEFLYWELRHMKKP